MPTNYTNGFAPTGPAPQNWREALAAILNSDRTMSMAGGPPAAFSMGQTLANAVSQPSGGDPANAMPQPSGGMAMTPTSTTAEEGPRPRMVGGDGDAPTLPMANYSQSPIDLSNASVKYPSFLAPGGVGRQIIGTLSDALSSATGGQPIYWQRQMRKEQMGREDARLKLAEDRENRIANRPVFNTLPNIGLVSTNADTGASSVIQPARSAARAYVEDDLGLKPTDPEYHVALADYLLKGNGPTAYGYRADLQDDRQASQAGLQDDRQAAAIEAMRTRLGLNENLASYREGLRRSRPSASRGGGDPRSTNAVVARILLKMSQGGTLTPGEQAALDYNRSRGRGGGGSAPPRVQPGGGPPRIPGTRENPATVAHPGDVQYLPSGTFFRDPNGTLRQKP